jgi:hypothetical protein
MLLELPVLFFLARKSDPYLRIVQLAAATSNHGAAASTVRWIALPEERFKICWGDSKTSTVTKLTIEDFIFIVILRNFGQALDSVLN